MKMIANIGFSYLATFSYFSNQFIAKLSGYFEFLEG